MTIQEKLDNNRKLIILLHLLGDIGLQQQVMELCLKLHICNSEDEFYSKISSICRSENTISNKGNKAVLKKERLKGTPYHILMLQPKAIMYIKRKKSVTTPSLKGNKLNLSIFKAIYIAELIEKEQISGLGEMIYFFKESNSSMLYRKNQAADYIRTIMLESKNVTLLNKVKDIDVKRVQYGADLEKEKWFKKWHESLGTESLNAYYYLLKMYHYTEERNNTNELKKYKEDKKKGIEKKLVMYQKDTDYLKKMEQEYNTWEIEQNAHECKYNINALLDKNIYISKICDIDKNTDGKKDICCKVDVVMFDTYNNLTLSKIVDNLEYINWALRTAFGVSCIINVTVYKYQGTFRAEDINKLAKKRNKVENQTTLAGVLGKNLIVTEVKNCNLQLKLGL